MPFNSEGSRPKHEMPKQDPDMAARGWGAGLKAHSAPLTEGSSLHAPRAARQPCTNPKKSIELLRKAPQGAPCLFLG